MSLFREIGVCWNIFCIALGSCFDFMLISRGILEYFFSWEMGIGEFSRGKMSFSHGNLWILCFSHEK